MEGSAWGLDECSRAHGGGAWLDGSGEKARERGKKDGCGPYHDAELRQRLDGEEGRRSGGSMVQPSSSGGSELGLGFAGRTAAAATRWEARARGGAIYSTVEGRLGVRVQGCVGRLAPAGLWLESVPGSRWKRKA
jgi:hypothetical protein